MPMRQRNVYGAIATPCCRDRYIDMSGCFARGNGMWYGPALIAEGRGIVVIVAATIGHHIGPADTSHRSDHRAGVGIHDDRDRGHLLSIGTASQHKIMLMASPDRDALDLDLPGRVRKALSIHAEPALARASGRASIAKT
jgi:hypothetical protein